MIKTYVLLISKNFFGQHPRCGQLTNFKPQILATQKIHSIRANYIYWERICKAVNSGRGILSVREWSGKPYYSKQHEFMKLENFEVLPIAILNQGSLVYLNNRYLQDYEIEKIAKNDGLSISDFKDWFNKDMAGGIIHFNDFRY